MNFVLVKDFVKGCNNIQLRINIRYYYIINVYYMLLFNIVIFNNVAIIFKQDSTMKFKSMTLNFWAYLVYLQLPKYTHSKNTKICMRFSIRQLGAKFFFIFASQMVLSHSVVDSILGNSIHKQVLKLLCFKLLRHCKNSQSLRC